MTDINSEDLDTTQSLLQSLSHDLKEPVRSIRGRIKRISGNLERQGEIESLEKFRVLEDAIVDFGACIQEYRHETINRIVGFDEIEKYMEDTISSSLYKYQDAVNRRDTNDIYLRTRSYKKDFDRLKDQSSRLRRRFESLLLYIKARGDLRLGDFGLHNEFEKVSRDLEDLISRSNLRIGSSGRCYIYADQIKIAQAIQNLLQNSVRYAQSDLTPVIKVSMGEYFRENVPKTWKLKFNDKTNEDSVIVYFAIEDNGQGIREERLDSIFRLFYKAGSKPVDGEEGTGIGLAITKSVIVAHGGVIWVNSVLGKGSKFIFALPKDCRLGIRLNRD